MKFERWGGIGRVDSQLKNLLCNEDIKIRVKEKSRIDMIASLNALLFLKRRT
jgi:hypothetical protein